MVRKGTVADDLVFEELEVRWLTSKNSVYILQAASFAQRNNLKAPEWVTKELIKSTSEVYTSKGKTKFEKSLNFSKHHFKRETTKLYIGNMVLEGIRAGLSQQHAIELAKYDARYGYKFSPNSKKHAFFQESTIQKYYEFEKGGHGDAYAPLLYRTMVNYYQEKNFYVRAVLEPFVRAQCLFPRLKAYWSFFEKESYEDEVALIAHTTEATAKALEKFKASEEQYKKLISTAPVIRVVN